VSLVYSGVFQRFPDLTIVLEEGGIGWMPALMWRLDRTWRSMRANVPHLEEAPSEVIRRHCYFTTQPLDGPDDPCHLSEMFGELKMDDRVMFASDYPHWDFDAPDQVLSRSELSPEQCAKIFSANALSLYPFEPAA
jgi:predicted TIM-barrel fold metal-dependent hydrolase